MTVPLSPAISRNGFIFISGQVYLTDEGILLEGTIEDQTHQVMKNIQKILVKENADFSDVVKVTIYTTDMSLYSQVNEIYAAYFSETYPAREMIGVKELPLGAKLEISMIAVKRL